MQKLVKGQPLPPPSRLKRKILIKNKRLKPEVEKQELELFRKGQLEIGPEESEDVNAVAPEKKEETEGAPAADGPVAYSGSTTNVHPWLSSMVNYTHPMKFQVRLVSIAYSRISIYVTLIIAITIYPG